MTLGSNLSHRSLQQPFATAAGWVLALLCVLWSIPTVGLLVSSLRPGLEVSTTGWWTILSRPESLGRLTLENYEAVLLEGGMLSSFLNTATVTLPTTILNLMLTTMAAFAFAWIPFRGREFLFSTFIVGLLVVPFHIAFIPLIRLFTTVGIGGSFLSLWLVHTGFGVPLNTYIIHSYMRTIPEDLIEAARVDGASYFKIFSRVILPLATPAVAAVAIFQFLSVWNDLLIALVFLGGSPNVRVLTIHLSLLLGSRGQDWHLLTAGAFVTMAVPLVVFLSLQRYFVRGLTGGAVKG